MTSIVVVISTSIIKLNYNFFKLEKIIPRKFSHCCQSSRPYNRLPNLGIWQRDWVSPGNLFLMVSRIWLQNFYRTGKQTLGGHKQKLLLSKNQEKGAVTHKRLSQTCLWVFGNSWQRHGSTVAFHRVRGTCLQQFLKGQCAGISPFGGGHHYSYHRMASGQTTGREHSHPSAEN